VVGGLDQESAGVHRSRLGDRALAALGVGGALGRDDPEKPRDLLGSKALKSPTSAHGPAAVNVSIPRKQRSRAIVGA
jgi:hypothetical protein